ncbi:hypothetical protein C1Y35_21185 [Pseudomonas sp. GW456-L14]|uniref:hypothetical protein n=1 Tax=unclassified Pseudomonas TaxID=196821 RepID=UPI000C88772F|nr:MULTISPECIES: hypothetical protein [unclassified Pseudomonas]PMY36175.1 hypothetical protein C1Y35_21185 [Pseudomonas sp. GW456-L14]PMY57055.1 hypothetical protein C1Y34_11300 [Pseudomonas sp. GW456-L12]
MVMVEECGYAKELTYPNRGIPPSGPCSYPTDSLITFFGRFDGSSARVCAMKSGSIWHEIYIVPYMGLAVIETSSEQSTAITDPNLADMQGMTGETLRPHQREWIANLLTELQAPLLSVPKEECCV